MGRSPRLTPFPEMRYWSLTFVGAVLVLASGAAVVWGTYELIGTESCGTATTQECSSDTALHITATVVGPFVAFVGMILLALRGGGGRPSRLLRLFRGRERRVADMVARGEMPAPVVKRPATPPPPMPPDRPTTWRRRS